MHVKRIFYLIPSGAVLFFLLANFEAFGAGQGAPTGALNEAWQCPTNLPTANNPIALTADSVSQGKKFVFSNGCIDCHGVGGFGDGPAANSLNPRPTNFHLRKTQDESDVCLFWKLTTGRRPMPATEYISERQRWDIINYIRGLRSE